MVSMSEVKIEMHPGERKANYIWALLRWNVSDVLQDDQ